jgi:hypothetical protein
MHGFIANSVYLVNIKDTALPGTRTCTNCAFEIQRYNTVPGRRKLRNHRYKPYLAPVRVKQSIVQVPVYQISFIMVPISGTELYGNYRMCTSTPLSKMNFNGSIKR